MAKKKGNILTEGDRIGITAPASPSSLALVKKAVAEIKGFGFQVEIGNSCYINDGGYLAGSAMLRAKELQAMFANPSIKAIICLRGGYGSPQILNEIDYEFITFHPKLFIGYSDITAIHIALQQKSQLVTIHGPMATSEIANGLDAFSQASFLRMLTNPTPLGTVINPKEEPIKCLVPGKADGDLIGGNLSLIANLLGTPYEIDTKGKILFLEEIEEEPYKIDRMLTQLALSGKFDDASALVLGSWTNCHSQSYPRGLQVEDLFEKIIAPFKKPTIYNVQAGHCRPTLTLPLGVRATVDATNKQLIIEESVVKGN